MSKFENDELYDDNELDYTPGDAPTFDEMWECGACDDCECDPANCYACGQCACYDCTKGRFIK